MYPYVMILGRAVPTYGLCMALAVVLVVGLSLRRVKGSGIVMEDVLIVGASGLGIGLACAKGLYIVVTYSPSEIWRQLSSGDFTMFNEGGLIFYGGLIGGLLGAWLGVKLAKCSFAALEGVVVPFLPLGHAIGRIGCVMAGCCYGMPYEGIGALHYPHSLSGISPQQGYFPVQLVEAAGDVAICLLLLRRKPTPDRPGALLRTYVIAYAILRFAVEFLRGDAIRGSAAGLSTSQWISLALLVVCVGHILYQNRGASRSQSAQ